MDVHLTRDDQLIVAHDDTSARMCAASYAWRDIDLAEARRLDAGWGFIAPDGTRPFAGKGVHVPLFEDVLDAFPKLRFNVDLKGDHAVTVMLEVLRRKKAEDRVTLASFHLGTAVEARRRGYGGETALSQGEVVSLLSLPALLWRQLPFTGTAAQV